ncbi:hypothetical protein EZV62_007276 [Acer yangbiense]|uniref:Uncharacterized protein n=1 Tax=Acer yangbiense TaxID=1000413 RepID=A0A5C7IAA2_9ROSI|nr:hypothetical protein EZV62_007276 [Acer yangbiense]
MIRRSRAEHKYLNPLQLFRQSKKRTYYMPSAVFLGLNFVMRMRAWRYLTNAIRPHSPELKCSRFGYSYCRITFPLGCSIERALPELQEDLERLSAQPMLQASLLIPCANTLLHDFNINVKRYEESKGRKKERVGKDKEREESKRKKRCKIIQ